MNRIQKLKNYYETCLNSNMNFEQTKYFAIKNNYSLKEIKIVENQLKIKKRTKLYKNILFFLIILISSPFLLFLLILYIPGIIFILFIYLIYSFFMSASIEKKEIKFTKYTYSSGFQIKQIFTLFKNKKIITSMPITTIKEAKSFKNTLFILLFIYTIFLVFIFIRII